MCGTAASISIDYMGFAVRTAAWRWMEWHRWNKSALRPHCEEMVGTDELYPLLARRARISLGTATQ
jgi:hypothetical protein